MHAEERRERMGETADRMDDTADGVIQPERMMRPERTMEPERTMDSERAMEPERTMMGPEGTMESEGLRTMEPDGLGTMEPEGLGTRSEPLTGSAPTDDGDRELAVELLDREDVAKFRSGWQEVQTRFVDDPKAAVRDADRLVGDVTRSLTATFSERKQELENAWQQGSTVETEDLRQALRRYRSFFDRLLNV
jgi:hypothetical protein